MNRVEVKANVNMSSHEYRAALFAAYEGKTKEERRTIHAAYAPIGSEIIKRELSLVQQGYIMG